MRHAVSAFLFPCLAMAACLRANALYTFGDASLTMYVGQTVSVPLYLYLTDNERTSAGELMPFSLITVAIAASAPDPLPDPLPAGLAAVQFNPLLGTDPTPGHAPDYKHILYWKNATTFGAGSVEVLSDVLSRVLVATLDFEAIAAGSITFQTDLADQSERVHFTNGSLTQPSDSSLQITVLPTAVPLPAACWGGLALLGVTVAARLRSAVCR